ncbi:extensin family protein [Mesorhizobium sp. BR1-1-16]|nr:extensin family protein [Mesorhizobium sp. BR1-1-16]
MPPAGTVIAPADALGTVIPPVQPSILPPAAPLPVAPPATEPAAPLPEEKPEAANQGPPRPEPNVEELAACRASLASLAVAAEAEPPLVEGECGAPDPFKVTGFQANAVTLAPAATIDCAATTALTHWVLEDVQPAAKAAFGAPVTKIAVAGSYGCRGRNNVPGARLSEHAFMNAIDISGFTIAGRLITVTETDGQSAEDGAFIATVRKAACARFTTVLGPGSDPEHATHLHLDVLKRGRNGDYRICE